MGFSEGTTVTTPFPIPGYGTVDTDRVFAVAQLASLSTRAAVREQRACSRRKTANRFYSDVRISHGGTRLSPVIEYDIFPIVRSSSPVEEEDRTEEPGELDYFDLVSLYASFLVDAARAQARGDLTRPTGQACSAQFANRTALTRTKRAEERKKVKALQEFLKLPRLLAASRHKGRGTTTPPKADTPMIAGDIPITVGSPEWDDLTDRRAKLIHKKNREGLNDQEKAEFAELQRISRLATAAAFPPGLSHLDSKLEAIEKRLGQNGGDTKR